MMNSFKRANASLTHAQIINEYEYRLRDLESENERLKADNDKLRSQIKNIRYTLNTRIFSLRKSLEKEPDRIKQAQLALCREIQGELK